MFLTRAGKMTNKKTDEKPDGHWKKRRARVRKIAEAGKGVSASIQGRFAVTGRPRSLDPNQEVLDKNVKTILGAGSMHCTLEEVAALHDVSVETLKEFFVRYPEIKQRFDEARLSGISSVKRNQFKLSEKSPQMAIYLGEQIAGQRDPYKMKELEQRERALELRERDVAAKERLLEMRQPADLGSGLPIDIKSLSLPQLMQLADRLRAALSAGQGLTIDAVASREREKTE